jgi:hypothetical protein
VSNEPEILSHFSDLLVLTIRELEYYLSKNDLNISFDYIFKNLYQTNEKKFTIEQIEALSPGLKMKKIKNS